MNNLAMSTVGGVPTSTSILNYYPIGPAYGGYYKFYPVDTAFRLDYLVYWNSAKNCAYLITNLPGWQGATANIITKYAALGYEGSSLGLPTSNYYGDAWGNSWQRFTNGYITSYSTGYGDMTNRAYYIGGASLEERALAGRYSKFFDYPSASGSSSYPLTQDPDCSNSMTFNPSCGTGKSGRFSKAVGPYGYVQTMIVRSGQSIAYNVGGEIGNKWRAQYGSTQPWNGSLGFPKSDEFTNQQSVTQQNFDTGYATWTGVAAIYTPALCSSLCPTSPGTTSCWNDTLGAQQTCSSASCSSVCNYGSETTDYCSNGTANSTCGTFGVNKTVSNCMRDPLHAGCNPLNQSNYTLYGTCNDGTAHNPDGTLVAVVPNVATRAWTVLSGPVTTSGTEQHRIKTLMNNAAALIGCNYNIDSLVPSDVNVDPSGQDTTKAAYVKTYGTSSNGTGCGAVYFNRTLGCAFPMAKTDTPPSSPIVAATANIFLKWNAGSSVQLGLPTSLPHRTSENADLSWQRFQNGYFTNRAPDMSAFYIGGTLIGVNGEGIALGARFGIDFDFYSVTNPFISLIPAALKQDTKCTNTINANNGVCDSAATGLFGKTYPDVSGYNTSYWAALRSPTAFATKRVIGQKYDALGTDMSGAAPNPTLSAYGVGWPLREEVAASGYSYQLFANGRIYSNGVSNSGRLVAASITQPYNALGGPTGTLGYPREDTPNPAAGSIARVQRFGNANISVNAGDIGWQLVPDASAPNYLSAGPSAAESSLDGLPISLSWFNDLYTTQTDLYRQVNGDGLVTGSGWTLVISDYNPPTGFHIATATDFGATPNARNCYYVMVNSAIYSNVICVYTRDGENVSISRIELRIKVATAQGAQTDDDVRVSLNQHNETWVDSPLNDFESGTNVTYSLLWTDIVRKGDVNSINIEIPGSDGMCVSEIELLVNRTYDGAYPPFTAFKKTYGDTSATCKWIYNSGSPGGQSLAIGFDELRASPDWHSITSHVFTGLNEPGLRSLLTAVVGHTLHDKGFSFTNGTMLDFDRITRISTGQIEDSEMNVTFHGTWWIFDFRIQTELDLIPQWRCAYAGDQVITRTTALARNFWLYSTINIPIIGYFFDGAWIPVVGNLMDRGLEYLAGERSQGFNSSPTLNYHVCFPISTDKLNGLGECSNYLPNAPPSPCP